MNFLKKLKVRRGFVDLSNEKRTKQIIMKNNLLRKKALKRAMPLK